MDNIGSQRTVSLPAPQFDGRTSIEKSLLERRSVRQYWDKALTLAELSQLLWAGQGVTSRGGYRTAPSAGALYPLETYIAAGKVVALAPGVYRYDPVGHKLAKTCDDDRRKDLWHAALAQSPIRIAPVVLVFCAIYERTTSKYGERGIRYVHMEIGHAAQNVSLQAISLGLGTVVIGAFNDKEVKRVLNPAADEWPLCIMPVGGFKIDA